MNEKERIEKQRRYQREYMRKRRLDPAFQIQEREYRKTHREHARKRVRKHRAAHRGKINKRARERYRENAWRYHETRFWAQQQLGGKCEVCGEDCWLALDFHHIDPATKSFAICTAMSRGWKRSRIEPELAKCILLCRNCHAILHWGETRKP